MDIFKQVGESWQPLPYMGTSERRLEGFKSETKKQNWSTTHANCETIAKAGFSFAESPDAVTCLACCKGFYADAFANGEDFLFLHMKESPTCPYMQVLEVPNSYYADISKTQHTHPDMADFDSRMLTFGGPVWNNGMTPLARNMAEAGFFVCEDSGECDVIDTVTCFSCGSRVDSWGLDDNPLIEHVKVQPLCRHIFQKMGSRYIHTVRRTLAMRKYMRTYFDIQRSINVSGISRDEIYRGIQRVMYTETAEEYKTFREGALATKNYLRGEKDALTRRRVRPYTMTRRARM